MQDPERLHTGTIRQSEDESGSDSSYEDNRSTHPLLPGTSRFPSLGWTPNKEVFSFPMSPSTVSLSWPTRWSLPRSFRRRYVVAAVISLITLSSIPVLTSNGLHSSADRVPPQPSIISPFQPPTYNTAPPIPPTPVEETEITEDTLPIHLQPDTHLEGWTATVHFRGTRSHIQKMAFLT